MEFKVIPFEVKSTTDDGSEGEGYGNAFHVLDKAQEIVAPGAFDETLPQFLKDGFIGGLNHNWEQPVGKPTKAHVDAKGLHVSWKLSDTMHGRDVKVLLKDKVISKLSIGYNVLGSEMLADEKAVNAYWQMHGYQPDAEDIAKAKHGARILTKLHLFEVSPVTVPANRHSDITNVKNYDIEDFQKLSDYEDLLREAAGLSRKDSKTLIARFKTLLRDAGSAQESDNPEEGNAPFSLSRFEAQLLALKTRGLRHAGAFHEQIPGTHSDLSG
jgi:uncharacterized protein